MSVKKMSITKILGIIFFIITLLILIICTSFLIYFGGQKKVVNNFYTSIQRQDIDMYTDSVISDQAGASNLYTSYYNVWKQSFGEDFKVKCNFINRAFPDKYIVNVTVYNKENSEVLKDVEIQMKRENGKWKIVL